MHCEFTIYCEGSESFYLVSAGAYADALGNNPVFSRGAVGGRATGGNYGFWVGTALVMVRPDLAVNGTALEMDMLGAYKRVTVIGESPRDPDNTRLRA